MGDLLDPWRDRPWTLGGIAAGLFVLKQILERDVFRADGEGITVLNYIGPFCKRTRIQRNEIKALRLQKQKAYLNSRNYEFDINAGQSGFGRGS